MDISGVGIWSASLRFHPIEEVAPVAAELEALGYSSLWIPDFNGGTLDKVDELLAATSTITVGTGILNLWMYEPAEVAEGYRRIREAHGDRFVMGIGISHASSVERVLEGATYDRPLARTRSFLDQLDAAPDPVPADRRLLAALGPKMLDLAAERAGGAHPYNVTPEHTAIAREHLGPGKLLVPEQAVALVTDAGEARSVGRGFLEHYLGLPNYANNLRRLGFTEDDLGGGGSDRLVDALVAWGDEEAIARRLQAHRDAGADGVCIQVLTAGGMVDRPTDVWRQLAPSLTGTG
jgi:probable F420-dependent oxidoreductase